ncbi:glycosyltransferase [Prochlorococcus sp. AH-716-B04]|nr:glycosyltransferase [Prochlorococcus sp. AH-716-B04]
MKILHINYSDSIGGAARAAYRIHNSLNQKYKSTDFKSEMQVIHKSKDDPEIIIRRGFLSGKFSYKILSFLNKLLMINFKTRNYTIHSTALIKTNFLRYRKDSKILKNKIIHLHWIGNLISIEEIGKIKEPIVWTLHDQWPFCGAEHYSDSEFENSNERYKIGYKNSNRPLYEKGIDINKKTWERKKNAWNNQMNIICPSNWMANCVRESLLMSNWRIEVIPNPIDTKFWSPLEKNICRKNINLSTENIVILFGAIDSVGDKRKGSDLLQKSLFFLKKMLSSELQSKIKLVVFGGRKKNIQTDFGFPLQFLGEINDDKILRNLYSAADIIVVPSRKESFGQIASEAQSCGIPVAAFRTSGLIDIVEHKKTGHLAEPFNESALAESIKWLIEDKNRLLKISENSRSRAQTLWDQKIIAKKYFDFYQKVLNERKT